MAIINVFTFQIRDADVNPWMDVVVTFDTVANIIEARLSNGDFAPLFPSSFQNIPLPQTVVFEINVDNINYVFKTSERLIIINEALVYPFVYNDSTPVPAPIEDLTVTATHTDNTVFNANDGTITVNVTGGTAPYEYSIDNVNWQSSNEFENLPAGTYIIHVRDSSTPIELGSVEVTILNGPIPPPPPLEPLEKEIIALSSAETEIQGAYKRAIVRTVFGTTPSLVYNGNFETYDGQNWEYWTRYGGISLSRGQQTVTDVNGNIVPIENYTLKFNQRADAGRFIEQNVINAVSGDKLKFSVNVGKTVGTGVSRGLYPLAFQGGATYNVPAEYTTMYEFRMRIKVGDYYLYNVDGGSNFIWTTQVAVLTQKVDNSQGDINSYTVNFNAPECPQSGRVNIVIFGFMKLQRIVTEEFNPGSSMFTIPSQTINNELTQYDPIEIDNVKLEKTQSSADNEINSIVNISDNVRYFTKVLDEIEIPIGDFYFRQGKELDLENLYAIKDQDGNYTTGWIDYTVATSPLPFGLVLARSMIKSYQSPYVKYSGDLHLVEDAEMFTFKDNMVFNVKIDDTMPIEEVSRIRKFNNKTFCIEGCDINIKNNTMKSLRMREMFGSMPRTRDISFPANPNTPLPPIVQDPNGNTEINGIFTEEFTEEFK